VSILSTQKHECDGVELVMGERNGIHNFIGVGKRFSRIYAQRLHVQEFDLQFDILHEKLVH
jgi:hypothetical protein